ncbi:hypothetical protein Tco_0148523, partial [Tanacetum coccineum]
MKTIHVIFDELTEQTTPVLSSSGPAPKLLTPGPISSGLVPNSAHAIPHSPSSSAHQSSSVHHGVATEHSFEVLSKVKLNEYGNVLKNKAHLVAKGYRQEEGLDFEESFAPV